MLPELKDLEEKGVFTKVRTSFTQSPSLNRSRAARNQAYLEETDRVRVCSCTARREKVRLCAVCRLRNPARVPPSQTRKTAQCVFSHTRPERVLSSLLQSSAAAKRQSATTRSCAGSCIYLSAPSPSSRTTSRFGCNISSLHNEKAPAPWQARYAHGKLHCCAQRLFVLIKALRLCSFPSPPSLPYSMHFDRAGNPLALLHHHPSHPPRRRTLNTTT